MYIRPVPCNANVYFGNAIAQKIAKNAQNAMLEDGIKNSISRNNHMNDYDGAEFDETEAIKLVQSMADSFGKIDIYMAVDVAHRCSDFASNFSQTKIACDCNLPKNVRDAVAVEYLNRLAGTQSIDLALYTSDLQ